MLQGLLKQRHTAIQGEPSSEKRWNAARVLADLLSRGPSLGQLTGAWTANRAELVRHIRHWVFVAAQARCKVIAQQVANVSYRQKAYSETRRKWHIDGPYRKQIIHQERLKYLGRVCKGLPTMAQDEVLEPAPSYHPITEKFLNPNKIDTHYQFAYEQELMGCATGNEYIWMPPNGLGPCAEMWVLPSHWVWPVVGTENIIDEYEIRPVEGGYKRLVFPAEEVLHIPAKSPISKIDGYSPEDAGSRWIDSSESVDQARWHTMKQGSFPSIAIELGPEFFDPSDEDISRVEQKWVSRYQGERRAGKPIIMPPGMKVVPMMINPREMDYIQSADQLRDCILALFGVPKFVVGIAQDVQRNTSEAALVQFAQYALNPTLEMRGQAYTKWFGKWWPDIVVWYDDCSPADAAQLNSDLEVDIGADAITVNQICELRGREPVEDGELSPAIYRAKKMMELQKKMGMVPGMMGGGGLMGNLLSGERESLHEERTPKTPHGTLPAIGHREESDTHGSDMNGRLGKHFSNGHAAVLEKAHAAKRESQAQQSITLSPIINVDVPQPIVNVTTPAPRIVVTAPEVNVRPAQVTVNVPKQDAPTINVNVPQQMPPTVNVQSSPAQVTVQSAPQAPPTINVQVPKQDAPVVNVQVPRQASPTVNVNVPKQEVPIVNVSASPPTIKIESPKITLEPNITLKVPEAKARKKIVKRDMEGNIESIEEE